MSIENSDLRHMKSIEVSEDMYKFMSLTAEQIEICKHGGDYGELQGQCKIASMQDVPYGVYSTSIEKGLIEVVTPRDRLTVAGALGVSGENTSLLIKHLDSGTGEVRFHIFEQNPDGIEIRNRIISAEQIKRKFPKTAEMFGLEVR